jgi:adenine deaminase
MAAPLQRRETYMSRQQLIDVALGRAFADTVIQGGRIVDVYTGEIRRADIAVRGGRIAAVGAIDGCIGPETGRIDATGLFVAPGLIDGHLHYHHLYLDPAESTKLLLSHGVTATADGFYGEAIVGGIEAVRALKEAVDDLPIRLIFLAPTSAYLQNRMFGLTPAKGVSIADLREMLSWPGCYGLDETPFSAVIDQDPGMLALFEETLALGKVVTGHVSGASKTELQAFVAMGGTVDHEAVDLNDALMRARSGMKILMRYGSSLPDLPALIAAYTEAGISPRQLAICTDVLLPETLRDVGGVDVAVRRTITAGVRPVEAIAMATLNVAETFRADHDFGSITPGRFADMILVSDLPSLAIESVFFGGKQVVHAGEVVVDVPHPTYPSFMTNTVHVPRMPTAQDFQVRANRPNGRIDVRVIGVSDFLLSTVETRASVSIANGVVQPDLDNDVLLIAMVDRLGKGSGMATAFVQGFGLKAGAIASTHNAICENIALVGTNAADMVFAAETVMRIGGGQVVVRDGMVLAALPMRVLGLFSDRPAEEVMAGRQQIKAAARDLGCRLGDPLLKLEFSFAAAEFPLLRMSEEGLLRTHPRERVTVILEDAP